MDAAYINNAQWSSFIVFADFNDFTGVPAHFIYCFECSLSVKVDLDPLSVELPSLPGHCLV